MLLKPYGIEDFLKSFKLKIIFIRYYSVNIEINLDNLLILYERYC